MQESNYGASIAGNQSLDQVQAAPRRYESDALVNQAPTAPQPLNIARGICIEQLNHGYIVIVGCQKFAVESKDALLHRLGAYLANPQKVEEEWMTGKLKW